MKPVTLNIDGLARSIARKVAIRFASNRLSLTAKEQKMVDVYSSFKWTKTAPNATVTASTMEELFNASRYGLIISLQTREASKVDFDAIKSAYREARRELERFHGYSLQDEDTIEELEWLEAQKIENSEAENEREKWVSRIASRCEHSRECIKAFWQASTSRKKASALCADFRRIEQAMALLRCEVSFSELTQKVRVKSAFWMEWKRLADRIAEGQKLLGMTARPQKEPKEREFPLPIAPMPQLHVERPQITICRTITKADCKAMAIPYKTAKVSEDGNPWHGKIFIAEDDQAFRKSGFDAIRWARKAKRAKR